MMNMAHPEDGSPDSRVRSSLDPPSVSYDDLHHTLQNARRRLVIRYLSNRSGPVDVDTLVDQVAAWELQTSVEDLPADQRRRIHVDLSQSQLPKLDRQGFAEYDEGRGTVEAGVTLREVDADHLIGVGADDPTSDARDDTRWSWLDVYTTATAVSALLLGVAVFGPGLGVSLPFELVATIVVGLYAAVTVGLFVDRR